MASQLAHDQQFQFGRRGKHSQRAGRDRTHRADVFAASGGTASEPGSAQPHRQHAIRSQLAQFSELSRSWRFAAITDTLATDAAAPPLQPAPPPPQLPGRRRRLTRLHHRRQSSNAMGTAFQHRLSAA